MSTKRLVLQKQDNAVGRNNGKSVSPDEYLGQGWMPVNGVLLQDIKKKLLEGKFTDNRRGLIDELKKDFGLLSYCLKNLQEGEFFADNPLKMLEAIPIADIIRVLSVSESDISTHSFLDPLKSQSLRFRHSLISCSTAESIAEKAGIDPDIAFSCAMIRQLGLNLVAWNYPRIYAKALTTVADGREDLETILFKSLGFAPRQVAVNLTVQNLSPDMKLGLGLEVSAERNSVGSQVARFCELSEAFAQINDPENYPGTTRRWKAIIYDLGAYLGPNALTVLKQKIDSRASNYASLPHKVFDGDLSVEKNVETANKKFGEMLFASNVAATKIPEDLQAHLKQIYSYVRPGQVSPEALQILVSEYIPRAGFTRGCVFLVDPASHSLIPKLRIGDRSLEYYKAMPSVSLLSADNPILEALQSSVPVKRDGSVLFGERVSLVSGFIGNTEKTGVLYLEMSETLAKDGGFEPVQRFKAIRHCLNECLNLKPTSIN